MVVRHLERLGDEALLTAMGLDERDAVTVFVRRFQRRVYGLALTVVGDPALADDVAQLAFERAWRHANSYDARRASVATWLLTITRNAAIDAMRVRRPIPTDPFTIDGVAPSTALTDPLSAAVASDRLERVSVQLATLPPEQRRAVLLATVAGRTAREIAEIEHIPLGTAKTRVRAGLRSLRASLARSDR